MNIRFNSIICILTSVLFLTACSAQNGTDIPLITPIPTEISEITYDNANLNSVPEYNGKPYTEINNNQPFFTDEDITTSSFEIYSPLDSKGRCGVAYANIGTDIMPTKDRQGIGQIKPAGWHTVKYDVVGKGSSGYLYNRCHLIGYQLAGENANERNLITGTRYLNTVGMLGFENKVADYVRSTDNHVLYRVTPVYEGDNLIATGVLLEALSVEDNGAGICFNVFCFNIQPGIEIDYATGDSRAIETSAERQAPIENEAGQDTVAADEVRYIGNKNTKKFHIPTCSSVEDMKESNKVPIYGTRDEAIGQGFSPCSRCQP